MVRGLVANGLGYSLLNARVGLDQTLDGQRFVSLPLKGKYEPLKLSIAHVSGVNLTRAASTFAEFSAEQIPKIVESERR
jgi:DNA-binding transcriptional LysR family regulator